MSGAAARPAAGIQLERARHALPRVRAASAESADFLNGVRALPAEIRGAGLGQALAMLRARGREKPGHQLVFDAAQDWLCVVNPASPYAGKTGLLTAVIEGSQADYRAATAELDGYLIWLKRLAEALLDKPVAPGDPAGAGADAARAP